MGWLGHDDGVLGDDLSSPEIYKYSEKYDIFQSKWQFVLASCFMRFSGAVSLLGSAVIMYMILCDRKIKLKRISNRILLGMSAMEIVNSSAWIMSVSAVPKGNVGSFGARGNQRTCNLQGFMLQIGIGVPFYSLSLCLYHYLVISRNVADSKISKRVEPFMHSISVLLPVCTAIAGIPLQLYNFNGAICYIMTAPWSCITISTEPCTRNKNYIAYLLGFMGFWIIVIGTLIIIFMALIYCSVRTRQRAMNRFNFRTRDGAVVESSAYIQLCRDKRDTGIQALLYISAFLCTYAWLFFDYILGIYTFKLLIFFFQPLQGFWNFFIYIRPRYRLISTQFPEKSVLPKLIIVVFYPEVGRRLSSPGRPRNQRRTSNGSQAAGNPSYRSSTHAAALHVQHVQREEQIENDNSSIKPPIISSTTKGLETTEFGMIDDNALQYDIDPQTLNFEENNLGVSLDLECQNNDSTLLESGL